MTWKWKRVAAKTAGFALGGYLTGNLDGAITGAKAGRYLYKYRYGGKYFPRRMPKAQTGDKRKARRPPVGSAPYKKPRIGYKPGVSRGKYALQDPRFRPIRVPRLLTKKIKSVVQTSLEKSFNHGWYRKCFSGGVNFAANTSTTGNEQKVSDSGTRDDVGQIYYRFEPFTIEKLVDALSVVYNGKAANIDYRIALNNFDTTTGSNFKFTYCSYALKLKNNSQMSFDVELVRAKPKDDTNVNFQNCWSNNIDNGEWIAAPGTINTLNERPQMVEAVTRQWHTPSYKFRLDPGQQKDFFTTFKGSIDFTKVYQAGTIMNYVKGISESWIFISKPVLSHSSNGTLCKDGRMCIQDKYNGVSVEVKELYKFQQPEDAIAPYEGNRKAFLNDYEGRADATAAVNDTLYTKKNVFIGAGYG